MLVFVLLIIGIFSRILWHVPNFTPVIALALFGGTYLQKRQAIILPISLMLLSDMIIGFHNIMFFTYSSMLLIALLGIWLKSRKTMPNILGASILSAVVFFIITNFGSWLVMYPHTVAGLQQCYIAAIPFFRYQLFSALAYGGVFFGLYEVTAHFIKDTRFAKVLLTA